MLNTVFLAALLAPAAHAGAVASHFRPETKLGANYWNAASAIDGKLETCWMVPGESTNVGESVTIDVPAGSVNGLSMVVGWQRDDETFGDYGRVKSVHVEFLSYNEDRELVPTGSADATFEDKKGWQTVSLPETKLGSEDAGGKVKISVTGVFAGQDYPNIAVSEMLIRMKEFDATPKVSAVSGADAGHVQESLMDGNPKSFWAAPADGASITLDSVGFGLAHIGILAGPKDYARPKKVKVTVGGRSAVTELPDAAGVQMAEVPSVNGYTGSAWGEVEIEILETWPGSKSQSVGISELSPKATNFEAL